MDKTTKIIRTALIAFGCVMAVAIAFVVVHEEAPQLFEKPQTEAVDTVPSMTSDTIVIRTIELDSLPRIGGSFHAE